MMKLQVSKQWYQFGLALGLTMDVLEEFNHYSEDDCLVEVLDYWIKHSQHGKRLLMLRARLKLLILQKFRVYK